jgi:hypothetical protein
MKIIKDIEQGSCDWLLLRAGKVTASGLKNILTPAFKIRTGEMAKTYMMQVLAERWIGGNLPQISGVFDLEYGKIIEGEARDFFTMNTGLAVESVAFIEADDERFGASPDGIINDCEGLELKAPAIVTHLKYLNEGVVPEEYLCQIHGSLYASGFKRWHFCSYRRNFPPLILTVERDEKIMATIAEALELFFENLDAAMAKLVKLNGGLPNQKHRGIKPLPTKDDGRVDFNN